MDNGIDALLVERSKADAEAAEKQVTGMLCIVQVIGIVDDAFDVAFVIAHFHACFKDVFHFGLWFMVYSLWLRGDG